MLLLERELALSGDADEKSWGTRAAETRGVVVFTAKVFEAPGCWDFANQSDDDLYMEWFEV